ncbi:hypothetical protein ABEB36_005681 [Hypothenemus hampei]|uniref:Uncharacterized protein n=1 Tax=Hypothenemus hampei TaxID=57062 RepID=A0ABD1EZ21_HYPHA
MAILFIFCVSMLIFEGALSFPFPFPNGILHQTSSGTDVHQIFTPLSHVGDVVEANINDAVNSKAIQFVTPFPSSGRKSAVLESAAKESIPIQADVKYAKLQQIVADFLHPKPIVDTIEEHEKYGNDGGKGRALSVKVVAAFEGFSNALNAAVESPFKAAKTAGRKLTESLNQIGGKLVGLS